MPLLFWLLAAYSLAAVVVAVIDIYRIAREVRTIHD